MFISPGELIRKLNPAAEKKPLAYTEVYPGLLYKGGSLAFEDEFNYVARRCKTIVNFVDDDSSMSEEKRLVKEHNKNNPHRQITYEPFPIHWYLLRTEAGRKNIKEDFIKIINTSPAPIYMHCFSGKDISGKMTTIFNEALQECRILTP